MDDGSIGELDLSDCQYEALREIDVVLAVNCYFIVTGVDQINKQIELEHAVFHKLDV